MKLHFATRYRCDVCLIVVDVENPPNEFPTDGRLPAGWYALPRCLDYTKDGSFFLIQDFCGSCRRVPADEIVDRAVASRPTTPSSGPFSAAVSS